MKQIEKETGRSSGLRRPTRLLAVLLCLSILSVTACSGDSDGGQTAMGRYVEEVLPVPEPGDVLTQQADPDGGFVAWTYDRETGEIGAQKTQNGTDWEKVPVNWQVPEEEIYNNLAAGPDGTLWLVTENYDNGVIVPSLHRIEADGTLTRQEVNWNDGKPSEHGVGISGFSVLNNGDFLFNQNIDGLCQYAPDGSWRHGWPKEISEFTVSGDHLYLLDQAASSLLVYNTDTLEQESSALFDRLTEYTSVSTGRDGAVYLYNANGLFRLMTGGSRWEQLIDGAMTSLSVPNMYFRDLVEMADGSFCILAVDDRQQQLLRYTWNGEIPARPDTELVVYSLYENLTLRQAIGRFHRQHPDTVVNMQVGMQDDGSTVQDQIRTLNTELLAGKGPDVLLLDGMNVENYIEKGVLLDLTEFLKDYDNLLPAVRNTWARDGQTWAIPAKFGLPLFFSDAAYAENFQTLKDVADFAEAHPERGIIGDKRGETLIRTFLPASAPSWMKGKAIDEAKLTDFLQQIRRMADTAAVPIVPPKDKEENVVTARSRTPLAALLGNTGMNENLFHWVFDRSWAFSQIYTGYTALSLFYLAQETRGDGQAMHLPGDGQRVFLPLSNLGIRRDSEQIDMAKQFLETVLSDAVQEVELSDGFPVNTDALKNTIRFRGDIYMALGDAEGNQLTGGFPPVESQEEIHRLCLEVDTPWAGDSTLTEMIIEETAGFFAGDRDIEKTVANIKEKTRLYLAE